MVGKRLVSDEVFDEMSPQEQEGAVPMRVLPQGCRLIRPGTSRQDDYRPSRLNVMMDADGNITDTQMF